MRFAARIIGPVSANDRPHPVPHISRRHFVGGAGAIAAALAWPRPIEALARALRQLNPAQDPYWRVVRDAFLLEPDRVYLNVGTLGAQPRAVVDAVIEHTRRVAMSFPPAVEWDALKDGLGALLGCDGAGLVFPRNTTEGMSFVANGLDLVAGDEILTTDHEHIGGLCCWQLVAARRNLTLRQLPLPVPPESAGQVVDVFRNAIGPRTRVISISHVTFTTGLVTPVRELVALARERGIISVVDGAHPPGMIPVQIGAIDPDFYASSPHKWLLAPQGTGFLWMREDWRTRLWPTLASGGWDDLSLGAHRFNHLGTFDESRLAGLLASLRFFEAVGPQRVYDRIRVLRRRLIDRLDGIAAVRIVSPRDDALGAGIVAFEASGMPALALQQRLAEAEAPASAPLAGRTLRVRTRVIGEYDYGWMRLSPHVYTSESEIDTVTAMIADILQRGPA